METKINTLTLDHSFADLVVHKRTYLIPLLIVAIVYPITFK